LYRTTLNPPPPDEDEDAPPHVKVTPVPRAIAETSDAEPMEED
jgi:hypothetical protein